MIALLAIVGGSFALAVAPSNSVDPSTLRASSTLLGARYARPASGPATPLPTGSSFGEAAVNVASMVSAKTCEAVGVSDPELLELCGKYWWTNPITAQVGLAGKAVDKVGEWTGLW